jgi:hypothetical protein
MTSPCSSYSIINFSQDKDDILPSLVAYFGVGVIFDPVDWIDPNHPGQTMLLSLGIWHGQPCILLDVITSSPGELIWGNN